MGQRLFPETGYLTGIRGPPVKLSWLASKPQGPSLPPLCQDCKLCTTILNIFLIDVLRIELRSSACMAVLYQLSHHPAPCLLITVLPWAPVSTPEMGQRLTLHSSSWHFEEGEAEIKEAEQRKEGPHSGVEFVPPALWESRKFNTINQDCLKRV